MKLVIQVLSSLTVDQKTQVYDYTSFLSETSSSGAVSELELDILQLWVSSAFHLIKFILIYPRLASWHSSPCADTP